jgi:hypothetical protein
MLTGPKEGLTEEAYYLAEFTQEEIAQVCKSHTSTHVRYLSHACVPCVDIVLTQEAYYLVEFTQEEIARV